MKIDKRNEHRKTCAVCLAIDLQTLENALGREITQEEYQNATGAEAKKFEEIIAGSWVTTKHSDDTEPQASKAQNGKGYRVNPELRKIVEKQAEDGLASLNNQMIEKYSTPEQKAANKRRLEDSEKRAEHLKATRKDFNKRLEANYQKNLQEDEEQGRKDLRSGNHS